MDTKTFTVTTTQFNRILNVLELCEDFYADNGNWDEVDLSAALRVQLLRQAGHVYSKDESLDMPADDAPRSYVEPKFPSPEHDRLHGIDLQDESTRSYVERAEDAGYDPSDPKAISLDMDGLL